MNTRGSSCGLGHIRHEQAPVDVDLGGSEADTRGRVHRLEHVVDQFTQWGVHGSDRDSPGA